MNRAGSVRDVPGGGHVHGVVESFGEHGDGDADRLVEPPRLIDVEVFGVVAELTAGPRYWALPSGQIRRSRSARYLARRASKSS
ncbi:hypothetical protein ACWDSL_19860 [Streptomyces sp. NPDC000941]